MTGLTVQNFLSAATGIAVAFALIRAFASQGVKTLGNAWIDIARITLYLLLPLAIIFALFFCQPRCVTKFFAVSSGRNITKPKPNYSNGTRRFTGSNQIIRY